MIGSKEIYSQIYPRLLGPKGLKGLPATVANRVGVL